MMQSAKQALSVGELVNQFKSLAEMSFPDVWVEGEVSQASSPASGHIYFTLKEDNSLLRCVLFKNKRYQAVTLPEEGKTLLLRGKVSVYAQRCELQLVASYIEDAGEGVLRREFDLLKNKLQSEGLFEQSHKQDIPRFPKTIAMITSASAAALQDALSTIENRYPVAKVILAPATVQGDIAPTQINAALKLAMLAKPDVILLVRGGGSAEDLHAFNNEQLAHQIYDCPIPVVSGVGHETDFTIADFVADHRALTPTDAAVLVTPDRSDLNASVTSLGACLLKNLNTKIAQGQQTKDYLLTRLKHPRDQILIEKQIISSFSKRLHLVTSSQLNQKRHQYQKLTNKIERLAPLQQIIRLSYRQQELHSKINQLWRRQHERKQQRLNLLVGKLNALSPLSTIDRGYAIVQHLDGSLINKASQLAKNQVVSTRLGTGSFQSKITSKTA